MQRGLHATVGVATAAGGAYVASGTGFRLDVFLGLEANIPAQCDAAKSEGGRAMPHFPSRKFTTRKQQVGEGKVVQIPSWTPPSRESSKGRLRSEEFDVLVIGGGATGSGVALDASTRGLKVAMVERDDFASGTSSRSTKLIHGGIRYLAQAFQSKIPPQELSDVFLNFRYNHEYMKIVQADMAERAYMIESAPFMTHPIPMMIPLYKWWEIPMMFLTGQLYDFIAGSRRAVPQSHYITRDEALYQFPTMNDRDPKGNPLKGGLVIYDGQQNDTRMNLYIAMTADQAGAACANHTEVLRLLTTGKPGEEGYRVCGAVVRDMLTGDEYEIRAKQVVNACGVFSDAVRRMAEPGVDDIMIAAPGTHLIFPDYASPEQMGMVWFTQDGRILYLLPWEGGTIAGTTDPGASEVTYEPKPTMAEIDFILDECNRVLKDPLDYSHVKSAWSGLRPLVKDPNAAPGDTKKLSRNHVINVTDGGLVTIAGGKWTTYRQMAEDAVDKCLEVTPELTDHAQSGCVTKELKLVGADRGGAVCHQNFDKVAVTLREEFGMEKETAQHLRNNYGTRALQLAMLAKSDKRLYSDLANKKGDGSRFFFNKIHPKHPQLEAEIVYACRHEYAETAVDVLARRTRLSFLDTKATLECLPRVLELMAQEKKWSKKRVRAEERSAKEFLETMKVDSDLITSTKYQK